MENSKNKIIKINPAINILTSKFIFIGGVSRSGKSFLCPIVSSFRKTEMFLVNTLAENISYSNKIKKLDTGLAKYLLQLTFNESVYNLNTGRNINLRKSDYTSILKHKDKKVYLKRMFSKKEGDEIIKKIKKNDHSYPVMFHDVLVNPTFLLDSFKKSKIIYIERHPIEVINEWIFKKYSSKFWNNPRNNTLTFKVNQNFYPYWSLKKIKEINASKNEIEKTIFSLGSLLVQQKKNFKRLKNNYKKKILILKFDDLVSNTDYVVKKVCKFLKTEKSNFTKKVIKREKGNRSENFSLRREGLRKKYLKFMSPASKNFFYYLERLYERK